MMYPTGLEFIETDFSMYYVASNGPQVVRIVARAAFPVEFPLGPAVLPHWCEAINCGGAGGAEFAPTLGRARILAGPLGDSPDALSGDYEWSVELRGVSPFFMRNLVDRLRTLDQGWRLLALHVSGAIQAADPNMALDASLFKSWLTDSDAYLGAWSEVPFSVRKLDVGRGAGVRVRLLRSVDYELARAFEHLLVYWYQAIAGYVNGSEECDGVADSTPRISCGQTEIAAGWDAFDYVTAPVERVLLNMLIAFHARVAALEVVDLAFQR